MLEEQPEQQPEPEPEPEQRPEEQAGQSAAPWAPGHPDAPLPATGATGATAPTRILDAAELLARAESLPLPARLGDWTLQECLGGSEIGVSYLAARGNAGNAGNAGEEAEAGLQVLKVLHLDPEACGPEALAALAAQEALAGAEAPGLCLPRQVLDLGGRKALLRDYLGGSSLGRVLASLRGRSPATLRGDDLLHCLDRLQGREPGSIQAVAAAPGSGDSDGWAQACLRLVEEVARSLVWLSEHGHVHGRLKPGNILLGENASVYLSDAALPPLVMSRSRYPSRGLEPPAEAYAAPETGLGFGKDLGRDIYSLGVVLYELLTLQVPGLDGAGQVQEGSRRRARKRMRDLNPALTGDVETVCLFALEPRPERRYQCLHTLIEDFHNLRELRSIRGPG